MDPAALTVFYGGTFDPVHNGHLAVARHARDRLHATVRLMPAADPPHRAAPGADAIHRARMLDLAVAGEPGLRVDRRELRRDAPSYTVDTLRGVRGELGPAAPVALLVGADALAALDTWRDWQALFGLAHFVVARRPGIDLDALPPGPLADSLAGRWADGPEELRCAPAGRVLRLAQPLRPESATEVRRRLAEGGDWPALLPPAVAGYVARHRLYGLGDITPGPLYFAPHSRTEPSP